MKPITANSTAHLSIRIAPVTPFDAFIGAAEALLTGVQPLVSVLPDTAWPLTFIAGQIVECSLKAHLSGRGVPEKELKSAPLRHDLLALWSLAAQRGLVFAQATPVWLQRLSELHDGPYVIRYPMGANGVVLPQMAMMAADLPLIVQAVRAARSSEHAADFMIGFCEPAT